MKKIVIILLVTLGIQANPVRIFTHVSNRPEFIEWQYLTFKKFMLDEYIFTVFNDAKDPAIEQQMIAMCKKYTIECIRIPQEIHNRPYLPRLSGEGYHSSPVRCANVIQYSLDTVGFNHNGIVMIIDSDMFLTHPFSVKQFIHEYDLAAVPQSRGSNVNYLWNGLVFMDMRTLPNKRTLNWNCGRINGEPVDVGGHVYYYILNNPTARINKLSVAHTLGLLCDTCRQREDYGCTHNREVLEKMGFDETTIQFLHKGPVNIEFVCNNNFFHYRGAGWDFKSGDYHQKKTALVSEYIQTILAQ